MGLIGTLRALLGSRGGEQAARAQIDLDRAIALHESGQLEQAERIYRTVLAAQANHPGALHLLGVVLHQRGDHAGALQSINAAIQSSPEVALYHFNRGNVHTALGDSRSAATSFAEAARLNPGYAAAWVNLGKARFELGAPAEAVAAMRRAYILDASLPGLRFDLAAALIANGDEFDNAKQLYVEAADLLREHWQESANPAAARLMFAYSLHMQDCWSEATANYRAILDANPAPAERLKAHSHIANCYNQLGRMTEAFAHYREALKLDPTLTDTESSIAACINYDPATTPQDVLEAHRDWARRFSATPATPTTPATFPTQGLRPHTWNNDSSAERPLRVGFVSADFRRHPVAALCAATLERLRAHGIETCCYYNFASADIVTARLRKAATRWHNIAGLPDEDVAARIESDRIDILVDLAGHTTHNRLGVFAIKPAPLQASWLGYFNSTGLDTIDYFLTDPHSSPPGQDAFFVEKLLRLPHTRFCFEPWEFTPEVNPLPALSKGTGADGQITFGCLNNLSKLNSRVLSLWGRVLAAVPGARLLVQAQALNDAANRERFAGQAEDAGIARARLELRNFVSMAQAAMSYHDIDIALDPFPFCGGMTSFDALWMGVPVVTLERPMLVSRQTLSMLHNLNYPEWIAQDEDHYVAIAAGLAYDRVRLASVRQELRARFAASPLMDYDAFARDLAAAFRCMWRERLLAGNNTA